MRTVGYGQKDARPCRDGLWRSLHGKVAPARPGSRVFLSARRKPWMRNLSPCGFCSAMRRRTPRAWPALTRQLMITSPTARHYGYRFVACYRHEEEQLYRQPAADGTHAILSASCEAGGVCAPGPCGFMNVRSSIIANRKRHGQIRAIFRMSLFRRTVSMHESFPPGSVPYIKKYKWCNSQLSLEQRFFCNTRASQPMEGKAKAVQ